MKILRTVLVVLTLLMLGSFLVPSARADEKDKKTVITFSQPFEIPGGQVLPAGTYTFLLFDSPSDRNIVRIFSADGTKLFATVLAINNFRLTATGKTVMLFSERPADAPDALKAWFYPNNNWGQEFVYPKRRAIQLAVAEKEPVPALTTDTLPVEAELKTAPIIAVTPEQKEVPVATVIQTAPLVAENTTAPAPFTQAPQPQQLPKTGSLLPLVVLLGVASLGFAFLLKRSAS
jgi:LPXTG-motif cell wall-anchored protein